MHPIVFLVGLHGSGKSSIGRHLTKAHQWRHISLGDMGRLARKGMRPSDVSLRLISCLAAHRPGEAMPERTCLVISKELAAYSHVSPVVCDGFPIDPAQLSFLPAGSKIFVVECVDQVRERRLMERATKTVRQWTPGNGSLRDQSLPLLVDAARSNGMLAGTICNDEDGDNGLDKSAAYVINSFLPAP